MAETATPTATRALAESSSNGRRLVVEGVCRRGVGPVSFTAEAGTFVAVTGPAASGKSTIIGVAAGFDRPDSGRVRLDGEDVNTMPRARLERSVGWLGALIPDPRRARRAIPRLVVGDDVEQPFVVEQELVPLNPLTASFERRRLDERLAPLLATIRILCESGAVVVVGTSHSVLINAAQQVVEL